MNRPRARTGRLVTFETQTRLERAWRTVGIFDDRPAAVSEAERVLAGQRTLAVRVVQVIYDPATTECTEYTVFRATRFDGDNQRARKQVTDQEMFEWGDDGRPRPSAAASFWLERRWPDWAPDWSTVALALSMLLLAVSVLFRWIK